MSWSLAALSRYAEFSGRSRRREYWFFALFNVIIYLVLAVIDVAVLGSSYGFGLLSTIFNLAMIIPGLAVFVRRCHDTGHSGLWFFIGLVPLVGAIVLLVFMLMDSEPGTNRYGSNPKAPAGAVAAW